MMFSGALFTDVTWSSRSSVIETPTPRPETRRHRALNDRSYEQEPTGIVYIANDPLACTRAPALSGSLAS